MSALRALPTRHDLPPRWDGRAVEWQPWARPVSTIRFHHKPDACDCGSTKQPLVTAGLRDPEPGTTVPTERVKRSPRTGRTWLVPGPEVPAWPALTLRAIRCVDCHVDIVVDEETGDTWELDASDYGDAGSTGVEGSLW